MLRICLSLTLIVCLFAHSQVHAVTLGDSVNDWSATGTQGENDWYNGYYNLTTDGDGTYDTGDFMAFTNSAGPVTPGGNHWTGSAWDLESSGGPWTFVGQSDTHPNGTNSTPGEEHWTIRRWQADSIVAPTPVSLTWEMRKVNPAGNGVGGFLFVNGTQVDSTTIAGNDTTGVTRTFLTTLSPGDIIDLALSPNGNDGADGSANRLTIAEDLPVIADSRIDFTTTGTQGESGWFSGYYNLTTDADGTYDTSDFMAFTNSAGPGGGPVTPGGNHWDGTKWDLESSGGPWTEIGEVATHPNGTNSAPGEEHWTIRRWVADVTGTTAVELNWLMSKSNPNGDGVTGYLFVNGVLMDTATIAGNDTAGVNRIFMIDVNPGDIFDLALSPEGIGGRSDGADGSLNQLILRRALAPVPEPTTIAMLSLCGIGLLRRRRA